jgi:MSHA biogenesis protein MshE
MKLGQILLHRRRIDRDQLREALRRQRRTGRSLGEIMLAMGIVTRAEVTEALLRQPTASAGTTALGRVRREIASALPHHLAERHDCLLLLSQAGCAYVAIADPLDAEARDELERALESPVVTVAARPEDLAMARERIYAPHALTG